VRALGPNSAQAELWGFLIRIPLLANWLNLNLVIQWGGVPFFLVISDLDMPVCLLCFL